MRDVIIIGAGVIGCSIARELSRRRCSILVLERGNDVSVGASKANSGIVHGGFDAVSGTLKAKYNVLGNAMFDRLSAELDFPFKRNGSMVLCFDEADKSKLADLMARGEANGVRGMQILDGEAARGLEPYISPSVVAALLVPSGGIVSPYEMTIAYAENAAVNGVGFTFNAQVTSVIKQSDGLFCVTCADGTSHLARAVVNCAGVYSDVINNMVCTQKRHITARKGDYELLDKTCGYVAEHTLFQLPTAMGKGVLVTPTVHGNILVGPTATDVDDKDNTCTTADELAEAFDKALLTVPTLSRRSIITQFCGLRAHCDVDDFILGEADVPLFFNAVGIESPGLTSAPAIAVDMAVLVANRLGLEQDDDFIACRKGIPHFAALSDEQRCKLIAQNPLYGKIVCRCEMVTEGEIVDAIHRPVGATDLDGVKRRVRAGMGRCQAGFCTPAVMEILARELHLDIAQITKRGGQSNVVVGRAK